MNIYEKNGYRRTTGIVHPPVGIKGVGDWVYGSSNIWDEEWEANGINYSNGSNDDTRTNRIRSKDYIPVEAGNYFFICGGLNQFWVSLYDADKTYLSRKNISPSSSNSVITITSEKFMRFETYDGYGTTYNHNIAIVKGTSGSYEPYLGRHHAISDFLDMSQEKWVYRIASVDLSSVEGWSCVIADKGYWETTSFNNPFRRLTSSSDKLPCVTSNGYTFVSQGEFSFDNVGTMYIPADNQNKLCVVTGSSTTPPAFTIFAEALDPYTLPVSTTDLSFLRNLKSFNGKTRLTVPTEGTFAYRTSSFGVTPPADISWSDTIPQTTADDCLWTRTKTTYTDATSSYSYEPSVTTDRPTPVQSVSLSAERNYVPKNLRLSSSSMTEIRVDINGYTGAAVLHAEVFDIGRGYIGLGTLSYFTDDPGESSSISIPCYGGEESTRVYFYAPYAIDDKYSAIRLRVSIGDVEEVLSLSVQDDTDRNIFVGIKPVHPTTTDNNEPLIDGDYYLNNTDGITYEKEGDSWNSSSDSNKLLHTLEYVTSLPDGEKLDFTEFNDPNTVAWFKNIIADKAVIRDLVVEQLESTSEIKVGGTLTQSDNGGRIDGIPYRNTNVTITNEEGFRATNPSLTKPIFESSPMYFNFEDVTADEVHMQTSDAVANVFYDYADASNPLAEKIKNVVSKYQINYVAGSTTDIESLEDMMNNATTTTKAISGYRYATSVGYNGNEGTFGVIPVNETKAAYPQVFSGTNDQPQSSKSKRKDYYFQNRSTTDTIKLKVDYKARYTAWNTFVQSGKRREGVDYSVFFQDGHHRGGTLFEDSSKSSKTTGSLEVELPPLAYIRVYFDGIEAPSATWNEAHDDGYCKFSVRHVHAKYNSDRLYIEGVGFAANFNSTYFSSLKFGAFDFPTNTYSDLPTYRKFYYTDTTPRKTLALVSGVPQFQGSYVDLDGTSHTITGGFYYVEFDGAYYIFGDTKILNNTWMRSWDIRYTPQSKAKGSVFNSTLMPEKEEGGNPINIGSQFNPFDAIYGSNLFGNLADVNYHYVELTDKDDGGTRYGSKGFIEIPIAQGVSFKVIWGMWKLSGTGVSNVPLPYVSQATEGKQIKNQFLTYPLVQATSTARVGMACGNSGSKTQIWLRQDSSNAYFCNYIVYGI